MGDDDADCNCTGTAAYDAKVRHRREGFTCEAFSVAKDTSPAREINDPSTLTAHS